MFSGNYVYPEDSKGGGKYNGLAVNCTFSKNSTVGNGGGMYGGTAAGCFFYGNSAKNIASRGGGMFAGTAANCVFVGNVANEGGGKCIGSAVNCTFVSNITEERTGCYGGGLEGPPEWCQTYPAEGGGISSVTATNCVFWNNTPTDTDELSPVTYSCLSVLIAGEGNISGNPLFVNISGEDYRLNNGSPCVDTGTPMGAPQADINGLFRPYGKGFDMGAHEYAGQATVPNLTGLDRTSAQQAVTAANLCVRAETHTYDPSVPPDHVVSQTPLAGTLVLAGEPMDLVISKGPEPVSVPNVIGSAQDVAKTKIESCGLSVGTLTQQYSLTSPAGTVLDQNPSAGEKVPPGTAIDLVVSRGGVRVPDLVGLEHGSALSTIAQAGLSEGAIGYEYSLEIPEGYVTSQSIAPRTEVLPGAVIDIMISKGCAIVPDLTGMSPNAAAALIAQSNLVVGIVTEAYSLTVPAGAVASQSPTPGTPLFPDSAVDFVVSKGCTVVPGVVGRSQSDAVSLIANANLVLGTVTEAYSLSVPAGGVASQSPSAGVPAFPGSTVDLVLSKGSISVPNVVGKPLGTVSTTLASVQLVLGTVTRIYSATVPEGTVISQAPMAATAALPGMSVDVVVSRGTQPNIVPNVVGLSKSEAELAITDAGLTLGKVTGIYSTVAAGVVILQSPDAGAEASPARAVNLVVSLGPAPSEGEGEPASTDTARQQLVDAFDIGDSDGDGALSYEEAVVLVAGLTQSMFNELDGNGDGKLSADELGVGQSAGCRGSKSRSFSGDWLAAFFGLLGIAALSGVKTK